MASLVVTGRLGGDAELKRTQGGTEICVWSMAYETGFGDKKKSHWVKCALFGSRAAKIHPYLTKGSIAEVTGEPIVSTWTDKKSGEARGQIEVSVFEVKLHGGGSKDRPVADNARATAGGIDDDMPF